MNISIVLLQDGKKVIESETIHHGYSETQSSYGYFYNGEELSKEGYDTDYWGRIENTSKIEKFHVNKYLALISKEILKQ